MLTKALKSIYRLIGFFILVNTLLIIPVAAQPAGEVIYVLVEPQSPSTVNSQDGTGTVSGISLNPYIIEFRETETIGLVLTTDSKVTLYTNSTATIYGEVYSIITDAKSGGYRFKNGSTSIPSVVVSSNEQNRYNNSLVTNYPNLGGDTSNYLATRPLDVLGGDEIVVIGKKMGLASDSLKGIVSLDFSSVNFQLAQIQDRNVKINVPTITEPRSFTLISNKTLRITQIIFSADGTPNPTTSSDTFTRAGLIALKSEQPATMFQRMRDLNVRIFPLGGFTGTYTVGQVIDIDFKDESTPARTFNVGGNVRPLEGAEPRLVVVGGGVFGDGVLRTLAEVQAVDTDEEPGALIVKQQGAQAEELVEAWLVEPQ